MKLNRYAIAGIIKFARKHPYTPDITQSEPHRVMDDEPVWTVLWKPDTCVGFPVATGLRLDAAKTVAKRHDAVARERSWAGRAEVILSA